MFTKKENQKGIFSVGTAAWAALSIGLFATGCDLEDIIGMDDTESGEMDSESNDTPTSFTVTIENLSDMRPYRTVGVFDTPEGKDKPGPALPGDSFVFSFYAGPGDRLSFTTMFGQSNDLFYAPGEGGLALFDEDGIPITGDVTDQVHLYNAGTEADEPIGEGMHQAPRQSGPNMGDPDPDDSVRMETGEDIPMTKDVIQLTLSYEMGMFTAMLEDVSTAETLMLSDGSTAPAPISPGVFVVHPDGLLPLFETGKTDKGMGLESQAEDGNPAMLYEHSMMYIGQPTPFAPGLYAIHKADVTPIFEEGEMDMGYGLEALAEDGAPSMLADHLAMEMISHGVFDTPEGAADAGPLFPGGMFKFTFEAVPGDYLSFASMFGQSNDLFFGPDDLGIPLFDDDGMPLTGDVTEYISLWDAGTEKNQMPGLGADQAPRQSGPNTGEAEHKAVAEVDDMFYYPPAADMIRVTLSTM